MNRVYAIVLLGWHFLLHYLKKITFLYDPGGIEQFRENFDDEGLYSLDERQRELLGDWQRCIGCGLCEAACDELSVIPEGRETGPRYVALSSSRDLSESDLAVPSADALSACDCDELQRICPVDIPVCDLAAFLHEVGERESEIRERRPGSTGGTADGSTR